MDALRKISKLKLVYLIILILSTSNISFSQSNYLHKRISVSFTDIPLEKALAEISEKGGFTFSYNSKNFDEQRFVSLQSENKSVAKTLDKLFENSVRYKVVGSHVILNKKNPPKQTLADNRPNEYIITGYIIDSQTGEKIQQATVYEVDGRVVALSNLEGYYSITVPYEKEVHGLSYSKKGYLDTVIMVEPAYKNSFNIYLNPSAAPLQKMESAHIKLEDIHNRPLVGILVPEESKIISDNLVIHDKRLFQVSFVPYLGTNRKLSGSVDNTFSFNVLAGYTGGINGTEIGGLVNIVRRDVYGAQIGGFANIVGGDTNPFQLAGFFNLNSGSVTGTQIGGMSNVVLDTLSGVQLAGFNNTLHGYMNGVQISGFNNVTTQNVDGLQLTGFVNVAVKDVKLGQLAGFANYCNNVDGGQAAGFANFAAGDVNWGQMSGFANYGKSVKGFQIAGFANVSQNEVSGGQIAGGINYGKTGGKYQLAGVANIAVEDLNGFQLAGYFNYSKKVNGYQLAILNVSDTIESGLPIGVFSFVKKGFHRFEISTNDVFYLSMAYKMGVKKLYNSIRLGYNFSDNLAVGYGIGSQFYINSKFNFNLDISSDFIIETNSIDLQMTSGLTFESSTYNYIGTLSKLNAYFDYNLTKRFSIFMGPSLNVSALLKDKDTNLFPNIAPYSFYNETFSDTQIKMWIGGVFGASFTL